MAWLIVWPPKSTRPEAAISLMAGASSIRNGEPGSTGAGLEPEQTRCSQIGFEDSGGCRRLPSGLSP
jgi:hypothetical protein